MIYALIYIFLAALSVGSVPIKESQRKYVLYAGAIVVLFFQALRWKTGTDWDPYYNEFLVADFLGKYDDFEFGYRVLNVLSREIFGNFTALLFIECGLNLIFIILYLRKIKTVNPCIGLLYFFSLAIFPIRFNLASSIVVYSYCYIIRRKFFIFLILNLIAFSIHRSAIIFLPMYFICQRNYSLKVYATIYIIAIILGLAADYTFGNILKLAYAIYGGMDSSMQNKMEFYITGEIPDAAKMTPIRYTLSLINSSLFVVLFYYYKSKYFSKNHTYAVLYTLYLIGISFNRIFLTVIPDLARATSFFTGGFIIMLIYIINFYKRLSIRIVLTLIAGLYFAFNYYSTINGYYDFLFLPYYSIFDSGFTR